MSEARKVVNAIATHLNSLTFDVPSGVKEFKGVMVSQINKDEIGKKILIHIHPVRRQSRPFNRGALQRDVSYGVVLFAACKATDDARIDDLDSLGESIIDAIVTQRKFSESTYDNEEIENSPMYDVARLRSDGIFHKVSQITLQHQG